MKSKKGFSLLELLVVIGIIAVLLAIGLSSYATAQKQARDAKRKQDLRAIGQALEQYYAACGYTYPVVSPNVPTIGCAAAGNIMTSVPVDPKTGVSYNCNGTCNTTQFKLCAYSSEIATTPCISNQQ